MTDTLFWWNPRRDARSFASEMRHHSRAWREMRRSGGRWFANFGDELSRVAVEEATGARRRWATIGRADLVAVGSILELHFQAPGTARIWGSGLREPSKFVPPHAISGVIAVRGHMTRRAMGLAAGTPVGDPGLLVRSLFTRPGRTAGVVVIPHFSAFNSSVGRSLIRELKATGARIIPPSAPVALVCTAIASAEHVITSSLHGQVVSDALGVPVTLASFGATREPLEKYLDYQSVFEFSAQRHVPAADCVDPRLYRQLLAGAADRRDAIAHGLDTVVDGLYACAKMI